MRRFCGRMILAGLVAIGGGPCARAQDEPQVERRAPPLRLFVMTDEQFERLIFGQVGGAEEARRLLESRLRERIGLVGRVYGILPEQKKKLEVAGRRDIQRLFDRVREKKEALDRAQGDFGKVQAIFLELRRDQLDPATDRFGDGSLFAKTLWKTLNPEQRSRFGKEFYHSRVEWVVSFKDRSLGLSDEQHRQLVNLIVDETLPLRKYGQNDAYAVMYQASRLPEAKIRRILDEVQWQRLRNQFQQVRRFEGVLVKEGCLREQGPAAPAPAAVGQEVRPTATGSEIEAPPRGRTGRD
jgi:hypothetical protein